MLKQNSNEIEAVCLKEQGNELFTKANYNAALLCFNKAIELNPVFKEAWLNKALCQQKINQTQEALAIICNVVAKKFNFSFSV